MAEDMLVKGNSYIEDYAGGTISVVDVRRQYGLE